MNTREKIIDTKWKKLNIKIYYQKLKNYENIKNYKNFKIMHQLNYNTFWCKNINKKIKISKKTIKVKTKNL